MKTYPHQLLEVAQLLAETVPPTQGTLRRCMSTAYYAAFHLLVEKAVAKLVAVDAGPYAQQVASRVPSHTQLKHSCQRLFPQVARTPTRPQQEVGHTKQSKGQQRQAVVNLPGAWRDAGLLGGVEHALQDLATQVFVLQRERERADYDVSGHVTEGDAQGQIERALKVFQLLEKGIPEPQWSMFLTGLLFEART